MLRRRSFAFLLILGTAILMLQLVEHWIDIQAERARWGNQLAAVARSRARLMSMLAEGDSELLSTRTAIARDRLAQLQATENAFPVFGKTEEFVIGRRQGDTLVILMRNSQGATAPTNLDWDSQFAEPMRLALAGKSGVVEALDYRGERVLAAYTPVPLEQVGVVAKIDMSEIEGPALESAAFSLGTTLLILVVGLAAIGWRGAPLLRGYEHDRKKLEHGYALRNAALQAYDGPSLFTNLLAAVVERMDCHSGFFGYREEKTGRVVIPAIVGRSGPGEAAPELTLLDDSGKPLSLEYIEQQSGQWIGAVRGADGANLPAIVTWLPIKGDMQGILCVSGRSGGFDDESTAELNMMCDALGPILAESLGRTRLEGQRRLLMHALRVAANAVVITDRNGNIVWANRSFSALTGYRLPEVMGRNPRFLKSGKQDDAFYEKLWNTILNGDSWEGEIINKKKSGELYRENMTISPVLGKEGKIEHFIAIKEDITEQHQIRNDLMHAGKMVTLGQMAAGVAHELNQPLSVIRMAAQMMSLFQKENRLTGDFVQEQTGRTLANVDRATKIINHLRIFGRKSGDEFEPLQIEKVIRSSLELVEQKLKVHSVELHLELEEDQPAIMGDQTNLEQVFINLLLNATDALDSLPEEAKREISISSHFVKAWGMVTVRVQDNGPGIPEEIGEKVFEPFFTTKEAGKGTGLGLSIVHGIMRVHHATIRLLPDQAGACFELCFPVAMAGQARAIASSRD